MAERKPEPDDLKKVKKELKNLAKQFRKGLKMPKPDKGAELLERIGELIRGEDEQDSSNRDRVKKIADRLRGAEALAEDFLLDAADFLDELVDQLFGEDGTDGPEETGDPAMDPEDIIFVDMKEREDKILKQLRERKNMLKRRKLDEQGLLPQRLEEELKLIVVLLARKKVVDPLFKGIQLDFQKNDQVVQDHKGGVLPTDDGLSAVQKMFAAIYGILLRERVAIPDYARLWVLSEDLSPDEEADAYKIEVPTTDLSPDEKADADPKGVGAVKIAFVPRFDQKFFEAMSRARAEYNAHQRLFDNILNILIDEGNTKDDKSINVWTEKWATVVQILARDNVSASYSFLRVRALQALASLERADDDSPPSSIVIDLPDLEQQVDVEIIADNLHAMQAIYFAASLEELKIFQVVDKLVELFQVGMLPLGKGNAGNLLYQYWKKSINRLSEYERRNLYARTIGLPGGETSDNPNREFPMLWLRFVSAVSSFARRMSLDNLLRANIPARVHQEQVRKAGRDLAANLSLYGYGMAYFAATELQTQINDVIAILSDPEVKNSYGARDMWGVIDQVAMLELGGARDSVRYRTMASSGAIIVRWLANKSKALSAANVGQILDENEIQRPNIRPANTKVTLEPYDSDLVNACERWLAVTGTSEDQVEQYAEPVEAQFTPSRPIQIPSVARDLLQSVGITASYQGNGNGRRR